MVLLRLRVALVGEPTSGKTAFAQMVFSNGITFPKNYLMTMGCEFAMKEVAVTEEDTVEVMMLDVAGQKLYDRMTTTYLDTISAFIVMYDVSNKATFELCKKWVAKARAKKPDMIGFLVANKMDLVDKSEVTENQAEIFARANQLKFFKCSALRGVGIAEPIEELARMYLEGYHKRLAQLLDDSGN